MNHCSNCTAKIISPSGQSDIMIVTDAPTKDDLSQGKLFATFTSYTTGGKVIRKELERLGVSLSDFRVTSLWQHEPNKEEGCWQEGYNAVLDEAKGKKAILLVGADVVETFTGYKVSDVSGLQVDSTVLSSPIIYASVSPALALARGMGEVRFALEKFVNRLNEEGLI